MQDSQEQEEGLRLVRFTFTEGGSLGVDFAGTLVTGVGGQAARLGMEVNDRIAYINDAPAGERVDELTEQIDALPRPGTIVIRRGWVSMVVMCPCLEGFRPDPRDPRRCQSGGGLFDTEGIDTPYRIELQDPMLVVTATEKEKKSTTKKLESKWALGALLGGSVLVVGGVALVQGLKVSGSVASRDSWSQHNTVMVPTAHIMSSAVTAML
jgi:hypothetical protein